MSSTVQGCPWLGLGCRGVSEPLEAGTALFLLAVMTLSSWEEPILTRPSKWNKTIGFLCQGLNGGFLQHLLCVLLNLATYLFVSN